MPRHVTLLQINDTHGYLDDHPELFRAGSGFRARTTGGYARIKSYLDRIRDERGPDQVLALDNGDTFHGTFLAVQTKGQALVAPLNRLGLDAWTVHWDAVWGPDRMQELARQLNHPLLALNCYREGTDERPFPASQVFERGGVRVGVIGLAATIIDKSFPERVSGDLYYTLGHDELPREIGRLREQDEVEVVIVLSHLGFPQDCQLAHDIPGIDVIVTDHHTPGPTLPGAVAVVNPNRADCGYSMRRDQTRPLWLDQPHPLRCCDQSKRQHQELEDPAPEIYRQQDKGSENQRREEPGAEIPGPTASRRRRSAGRAG